MLVRAQLSERSRPLVCIYVSKIRGCKAASVLWGWHRVTSLLCHVSHAFGLSNMHGNKKRKTEVKTKTNGIIWSVQPLLTFSDDLLNSDLVPPDSEGSANEISACMTGPRAATSSSRTRPGAHQLPTRIKELPHVVEASRGGLLFYVCVCLQSQTSCLPSLQAEIIAQVDNAGRDF